MAIGQKDQGIKPEIKKDEKKKQEEESKYVKSKLDDGVLDLVKMIFDMNLIEKSIVQVGYDLKRLPLG